MFRHALLRHRVAAGVEHLGVLKQLPEVATVVDVGANRGQFALAVSAVLPSATVESFEPLPAPAEVFRGLFSSAPNVRLHPFAIGPKRETTLIHISARDDSSSLLPISERQSELFAGTQETGQLRIEAGPLDAFLEREQIKSPALLKIDVQGFELQTLRGCESMLDRFSRIYVECSFVELYGGQAFAGEVIAWLRERHFELHGVFNMSYDSLGCAVQADFLFNRC